MSINAQAIYLLDNYDFSGEDGDYVEVAHNDDLALTSGTVAFKFVADDVSGTSGLFSKDHSGYKDGGHFSIMLVEGQLKVRIQSQTASYYAKLNNTEIVPGEEYHVAVSFGGEGLQVFLNGQRMVMKPDVTLGIETNEESFVVGALGWQRNENNMDANSEFDGTISNFGIYDEQLELDDVIELIDGELKEQLLYEQAIEDLMPAFAQLHHGSDFLREKAAEYGYGHHEGEGHMMMKDIEEGTDGDDTITGDDDADFINGGMGDDTINGAGGNDELQGYYGNDTINGGDGNDLIDGGHGEDLINGGDGDDFIISRADGREGYVTYDPDRDEADPYNELDPVTGKLYPDQPIPADDVLTGGAGADTFYFQTLINAKERFITKHAQSDGTIRWHGVAGENDNIHDHWVDVIGNDVITDFSKAEGDQIVIEGHTTEILNVTHHDSNGDGALDSTLIELYSDQGGGGGAHNDDLLGTITVFGDLVTEDEIQSDAGPAYGIVKGISDLDEAITPLSNGEERDFDPILIDPVTVNGPTPLYSLDSFEFSGEKGNYLEVPHSDELALTAGTVAMNFVADDVSGTSGLFSKDHSGYKDGGHFSIMLVNGQLKVRLQTLDTTYYAKVNNQEIVAGEEYHLATSFGEDGFQIFLNGELLVLKSEVTFGIETNEESFVVGALGWQRTEKNTNANSEFDGTISNFAIYDYQLQEDEVLELVDDALKEDLLYQMAVEDLMPALSQLHHGSDFLREKAAEYGYGHHEGEGHMMMPHMMKDIENGTDGDDTITGDDDADFINAGMGDDTVNGGGGNDEIQGFYGNDTIFGGDGNDLIDGGHGEDFIDGGDGDDFIISQADGREGYVTYDPDRDEADPYNELDPVTGKLYPDQPIPADDVLTGGAGADTFYFQTLINAKERFISKHTQDDGTIRWHGVAGENDNIHDHWVDVIGNDVITDFSKAEGDKIVIEGHTTEILNVIHQDSNGDGVLDSTLIELYSDQGGGGGAHNDDLLGTITVFGDFVTEGDILADAGPAYGIVKRIADLDEAITPLSNGEDRAFDPVIVDPVIVNSPDALFVMGAHDFSGEDGQYLEVSHNSNLALTDGTVAFDFRADDVSGTSGLFSKDASGFKDGGHFSVMIIDGYLKVRIQSETESFYAKVHEPKIVAGEDYHAAISFGAEGLQVFLNGELVTHKEQVTQGIETNEENFVIGALGWRRKEESDDADSEFDGLISNLGIYEGQLSSDEVTALIGADLIGETVVDETPPGNSNPVAQDDVFDIDQGDVFTGFFHRDNGNGVDTDPDGDVLTYQAFNITTANGANVLSDANGWFRYTPTAGFSGVDTFTYTVSDGNGGTDTGTVTVNVAEVALHLNSAPVAQDDVFETDQGETFTGFFYRDNGNGRDVDPDGDPLAYQSLNITTANGANVLSDANGWFRYTPEDGFLGTDTFTYTVSDGNGGTDTGTVTVNVGGGLVAVASASLSTGEVLYGTDQIDTFTWLSGDIGSPVDEVRDFVVGEDILDISDALLSYDPVSDAITDFVMITDDGVSSTLKVDVDGGADNFVEVAKISDVTGLTDESQLVTDGTLVV